MLHSQRKARVVKAVLLFIASAPSCLFADNLEFFPANSARTNFDSTIQVRVAGRIESAQPKLGVDGHPQEGPQENTAPKAAVSEGDSKKQREEEILSKYNIKLDEKPKTRTVDNAPPTFKCMMEALDGGLDELAYQCAKRWKLEMANLSKNTSRVGSIMEEVDRELGAQEGQNGNTDDNSRANRVKSEKAKELLKQVEEDLRTGSKETIDDGALTPDGKINRVALRQSLIKSGKVPVDPQGKVNVLFFLDPTSVTSDQMAKAVEALKRTHGSDPRISIVGVTVKKPLLGAIDDFKARNKLSFNISDGSAFAPKVGIETSPAIILMTGTSKRTVLERGVRPFEYLDEVVQIMKGEAR